MRHVVSADDKRALFTLTDIVQKLAEPGDVIVVPTQEMSEQAQLLLAVADKVIVIVDVSDQ